jgi:hypothetical protein
MAELNNQYVAKAKELVLERFPEMDGAEPSVSKKTSQAKQLVAGQQDVGFAPAGDPHGDPVEPLGCGSGLCTRYVVTFETDVQLPGGGKMKRLVRVTMDETGEVLRFASSK